MGTDFSRVRLDALLDYAGVELKQGAVLLDGDANELMDIVDRRLRALASDVLDRATVSSTTPDAFKIVASAGMLEIGVGRLYVDGLLAECHGGDPANPVFDSLLGESRLGGAVRYDKQPYLPSPPALPAGGRHLVYLEVWNQEVTHLEAPALVEPAVGVETSSRVRTVWQVRVLAEDAGDKTCASPDAELAGWPGVIAPSTGLLTVGTVNVAPTGDPCELPPTGGYRGLENQLYRVEIHDSGQPGGTATFKWSRDNGSVGSRVASMISLAELELETLGRDDVLSLKTGDWVEINNDFRRFSRPPLPGVMRKITVFEATRHITFATNLPADMDPGGFPDSSFPGKQNMTVRRWDQKEKIFRTGSNVPVQNLDAAPPPLGVIKVPASGTVLLLEHGVTVEFHATPGKGFSTGDYWVFAARTADASVEELKRATPRGIHRHFARLGIWKAGTTEVSDCRHKWPPEVGHDCSCTACVTEESHASKEFTIQDAVDKVKERGGTVCLGRGLYRLDKAVAIDGAISLRIRGQGLASLILAPEGAGAFEISGSMFIAIENLGILSVGQQPAIAVDTAIGLSLTQLIVGAFGQEEGRGIAISLQGAVADATIAENVIFAATGVFAQATGEINLATGAVSDGFSILFTAALKIDDNIFVCTRNAVAIDGNVLHFLGTRITGNEIIGCREVAVSTTGFAAPASSMTISRNDFWSAGDGIRCAAEGVWIEGNRLLNSEAQDNGSDGIRLVPGTARAGIGQAHILANQAIDYGGAGIHVDTPVGALVVKQNIVEQCGRGIVSVPTSKAGKITIENNQLREVGTREMPAAVVGIQVIQAASATIAGNTIRSLGMQQGQPATCTGISTWNVDRARILANEITNVGPPGAFQGTVTGILLRGPLTDFEVHHNRIEREIDPIQDIAGNWTALRVGEPAATPGAIALVGGVPTAPAPAPPPAPASGPAPAGRSDQILIGSLGLFTFSDFGYLGFYRFFAPSGSILGNVIKARGVRPAVEVTANDCLFNDNRVEATVNVTAVPVVLSTQVAVVSANRVIGGRPSIVVNTGGPVAMLGNITSGGVMPATGAFGPLNLIG